MSWKNDSLHKLFYPESIAVIGASDKREKLGALSMLALSTFQGKIYPVNPRLQKVGNLECYHDLASVGAEVDLAIVALGPAQVHSAIEECARNGTRAAVVFAAGFRELGADGIERQAALKEAADHGKVAVIGPNCLGAGNMHINLNATFFPHPIALKKGSCAILSQSGGVCGQMLYRASDTRLGISKFVSVGNRVNIDFEDLLRYLRADEETRVICMFVEGTERARGMHEEVSLTSREKPVIVYKVGRTPASSRAALSHTGSMAGSAELYSASFRQSHAVEVDSVLEMMDTAKVFSTCRVRPRGRRVAILTHTLGTALVAAQNLEERGAILPNPSDDTIVRVEKLLDLPVKVTISNPIDLLAKGWAEPGVFAGALEAVARDDAFDALLIVFSPNYQESIGGGLPIREIVKTANGADKPLVGVLNSPELRPPPGMDTLESSGVPCFSTPERAGRALANFLRFTL